MIVNEIYLWGAALVAFLVVVAMLALAFVDRKMLRRMLVVFGATVAQMVVVGAVVLLAFKTFAWPICSGICWCCFCRSAGCCILSSLCGKGCCCP